MDAENLIKFAKGWNDMGWTVQEEVEHLFNGSADEDNVGPGGMNVALARLGPACDCDEDDCPICEVVGEIRQYLDDSERAS